jgi:hypothetical protein
MEKVRGRRANSDSAACAALRWCSVPLHRMGSSEQMAGDLTCSGAALRETTRGQQVRNRSVGNHG